MKMKRLTALAVALLLAATVFAGCGQQAEGTPADTTAKPAETKAAAAETPKAEEPVKLTFFEEAKNSTNKGFLEALAAFEKETGTKVEFNVVPGEGQDKYKKVDIALMSGDTTDIIKLDGSVQQVKYSNAKLILPLDDLAKEADYDLAKVYGKNLKKNSDGKVDQLPYEFTVNLLFYNKKLFDDAKIPYPKGKWTWDQYIDTAEKLTDPAKGQYGSLMQQWEQYTYYLATQKKVSAYKADGTANLDDPAFKDALKFFNDLSAVHKIQPGWLEMSTKKIGWDAFLSGKYAMEIIGTWRFGNLNDSKSYPRDWKFGIACAPGDGMLSAGGTIGINKNSKHPKEAFKFVTWMAENFYGYISGLPARTDWTPDQYKAYFTKTADTFFNKDITPDDMYDVIVNNGMEMLPEKIAGPGCAEINTNFTKEGEMYFIGKRSLDDTIKVMQDKANEAIKKEKSGQ